MKKLLAMLICLAMMLSICVFFTVADEEDQSLPVTLASVELNKKGTTVTVTIPREKVNT